MRQRGETSSHKFIIRVVTKVVGLLEAFVACRGGTISRHRGNGSSGISGAADRNRRED